MKQLEYSLIKSDEQYDLYCNKLEELVSNPDKNKMEEIELISLLIHTYNEEVMNKYESNLNPVELIQELISDNNLTQIEFAKRLNVSPQLINDVIKYRREITKKLAYKLSEEFKIKYASFLKPYNLKKAS